MTKEIGWFKVTQKPVRIGVYRTRAAALSDGFSFFDGNSWGSQRGTVENAYNSYVEIGSSGAVQKKGWCGLAKC